VFISVSDKSSKGRTTDVLKDINQDLLHNGNNTETVLLTGTPSTYHRVRETRETPAQDLIDSSLKSKPEIEPQTNSGKSLKKILKEQEEKRQKISAPDASGDHTPQADPGRQMPKGSGKDDHPSKKPETPNGNNAPKTPSDDPKFKPEDPHKNRPQDREFKDNFEDKPEWRDQKPGNSKDHKDKN